MSRVGKRPIQIPSGVTVKIKDRELVVEGPKGSLKLTINPEIKAEVKEGQVFLARRNENKISRSLHGLNRTLIANMVEGVTGGFSKTLKLVGIGYRASMEGETLVLSLGFSHPVKVTPSQGIKLELEGDDKIKVTGINKALVGQWTAKIRALKPPEPYKGKGIYYQNEEVKRKPGKAGKLGAVGAVVGGAK